MALGGYSQTGPRGPDFYQLSDRPVTPPAPKEDAPMKKPKKLSIRAGAGAKMTALKGMIGMGSPDLAAGTAAKKSGRAAFKAMVAKKNK